MSPKETLKILRQNVFQNQYLAQAYTSWFCASNPDREVKLFLQNSANFVFFRGYYYALWKHKLCGSRLKVHTLWGNGKCAFEVAPSCFLINTISKLLIMCLQSFCNVKCTECLNMCLQNQCLDQICLLQGLSLELIFSFSLFLWLGSSIVTEVCCTIFVYIGHFDIWLLK